MNITGYFVIDGRGRVRFLQKPPVVKKGEIAVKVDIEVVDLYFEQYPSIKLKVVEDE